MHRKKFAIALHSRDEATGRSKLRSAFDHPGRSLLVPALAAAIAGCQRDESTPIAPRGADVVAASDTRMNPATLAEGKKIFRFDTYGDETFWTDTLRMHEVIRTSVEPGHGPFRRSQGRRERASGRSQSGDQEQDASISTRRRRP